MAVKNHPGDRIFLCPQPVCFPVIVPTEPRKGFMLSAVVTKVARKERNTFVRYRVRSEDARIYFEPHVLSADFASTPSRN